MENIDENSEIYRLKYLKYKSKYLNLMSQYNAMETASPGGGIMDKISDLFSDKSVILTKREYLSDIPEIAKINSNDDTHFNMKIDCAKLETLIQGKAHLCKKNSDTFNPFTENDHLCRSAPIKKVAVSAATSGINAAKTLGKTLEPAVKQIASVASELATDTVTKIQKETDALIKKHQPMVEDAMRKATAKVQTSVLKQTGGGISIPKVEELIKSIGNKKIIPDINDIIVKNKYDICIMFEPVPIGLSNIVVYHIPDPLLPKIVSSLSSGIKSQIEKLKPVSPSSTVKVTHIDVAPMKSPPMEPLGEKPVEKIAEAPKVESKVEPKPVDVPTVVAKKETVKPKASIITPDS